MTSETAEAAIAKCFEETKERCAKVCEQMIEPRLDGECCIQSMRSCAGVIRALSPTGQPDDRTAAEQDLESSTAIYDQPCYTPETPVAVQASMSNFAPPAAAPIQAHSKSQYKRLVTQGADVAAPSGGQTASLTDSQESPAGEHLVAAAPIRHDIVGVKYPPTAAARIVQRADLPPQPATVLTTTAPYLNDPASALAEIENDERAAEAASFISGLERAAEIAVRRISYSMPIPCPDNMPGCCVAHSVPATREQTGAEVAEAIRAEINRAKGG